MSSWLNQHNSVIPDKLKALCAIERMCPTLPSESRLQILQELEIELRSWSPYKKSLPTFEQDWVLCLERICRETRDKLVSPLERRVRESRDPYEPGPPLTRDALLRSTAEAALSVMPFEYERRNSKMELDDAGEVAVVDLSSLSPRSEFLVAKFDWNFFATDFRRIMHKLVMRDGHLCVRTTKEVSQNGRRIPRLVPVRSIVAALRYGKNFDSLFLTAEAINGNLLDLRRENTRIPALTESDATRLANKDFNDGLILTGATNNGWLERLLGIDYGRTAVPLSPDDAKSKSWMPTQAQKLQKALDELSWAEKKLKSKAASEEVVEQAKARKKKKGETK